MTPLLQLSPEPSARTAVATEVPDRLARRSVYVRTTAETAECTCPDFCERDHGNE